MNDEYTIKVTYTREIPNLIDEDGTVLAVAVVDVVQFIRGTLDEIAQKVTEMERTNNVRVRIVCS